MECVGIWEGEAPAELSSKDLKDLQQYGDDS